MKRILYLFFALLTAAAVEAQDRLVLVSPHWEGVRYETENAFKHEYAASTGREVTFTWLDIGGTSDILRFLHSEFTHNPQSAGIDLLFGGGIDPFLDLKRAGLLESFRPYPDTAGIADSVGGIPLHDPDFMYSAPCMAAFGIMCNREVLRRLNLPQPRTWSDLTHPAFHGWIGAGDPRKSGSIHMAYEIILQAHGWDQGWNLILGLARNIRSFVASSTQVSKDIADGEVACGFAIDSHAWAQIRTLGADRISYVVPEAVSTINGDSIAILKGAPNRAVAQKFVQFLYTPEAQRIFFYRRGEAGGPQNYELSRLPVMPRLYRDEREHSAITLDPFGAVSPLNYSFDLGSRRWTLINDLFEVFVIDRHRALIASSAAVFPPPIDEVKQMSLLTEGRFADQRSRAEIKQRWSNQHTDPLSSRVLAMIPAFVLLVLMTWKIAGNYRRRRNS